jgi:hypothetical protein
VRFKVKCIEVEKKKSRQNYVKCNNTRIGWHPPDFLLSHPGSNIQHDVCVIYESEYTRVQTIPEVTSTLSMSYALDLSKQELPPGS